MLPSDLGEIGAAADECAFAYENLEKAIKKTLTTSLQPQSPRLLRTLPA
ncbi:hypothetical protein [Methanosarcina horonobensis]|nr:hypothetical protein [Methanosarcina horonobensis]